MTSTKGILIEKCYPVMLFGGFEIRPESNRESLEASAIARTPTHARARTHTGDNYVHVKN